MDASLGKLMRILALERQQGYEDRAVIGGLEAFLGRLRDDAGLADRDLARIVERLNGYGALSRGDRALRVAEVESHLRELAGHMGSRRKHDESPAAATQVSQGKETLSAAPETAPETAPQTAPETAPQTAAPGSDGEIEVAVHEDASQYGDEDPGLDRPVVHLRGVGASSADKLERLGIVTIRDMLYFAPSRYNDFSTLKAIRELHAGETATIVGTVWDVRGRRAGTGRHVLSVLLNDTTAKISCTFFNQPFLEREFRKGRRIVVSGRVEQYANKLTFRSPEWEPIEGDRVHTGRLVPVYPLTEGLAQRRMRRQIWGAVERWAEHVAEILPSSLRESEELVSTSEAIRFLHSPADADELAAARRRLALDELLVFQLWQHQRRRRRTAIAGIDLSAGAHAVGSLLAHLPFEPTGAQSRAMDEIIADMGAGPPMSRLLQGDVGSGKTLVAAAAAVMCVAAGRQAVIMAPTEILAEQHFVSLQGLLEPLGYEPFDPEVASDGASAPSDALLLARLVGSMRDAEKESTKRAMRDGDVHILVGTHAVIQADVDVPRLGLSVIDEQHRFGVMQRAELPMRGVAEVLDEHAAEADNTGSAADGARQAALDASAGESQSHVLVMTATPIPRTLAKVFNADLDQSMIDEMPPGRKPIKTYWLRPSERERAYQFIRHRLATGEQAYVVCPRVDAAADDVQRAAVVEHARLSQDIFPQFEVGLLHGQLPPSEKDAAMRLFRDGETSVLVATSVIEVGVDVPNATVMLVEGADRFGLAQLHQFRGRVGRGSRESTCLLLAEDPSDRASERLAALARTNDGVELAEKDLQMRGPGDYFGLRQAGYVDWFRFARLTSGEQVNEAQRLAQSILDADENLAADEWRHLGARVESFGAAAERV